MLRLTKQSDLESVFTIYMHESVVPYMGYDQMPIKSFEPIFNELLNSKCFYLLEIDSVTKGFCRINCQKGRSSHVANLATLAIDPGEQGTGIAQLLMKLIFEYLASQEILRVELTVEEDNPRAFAFYKKQGFQLEGTMYDAYKRSHESHYTNELFLAKFLKNRNEVHV